MKNTTPVGATLITFQSIFTELSVFVAFRATWIYSGVLLHDPSSFFNVRKQQSSLFNIKAPYVLS